MELRGNKRQKRLGLSFSGGGVRGYAQMAVYEALEQENIELSAVAGTSMGSFVAAGVAYGLNSEELYDAIVTTDLALQESSLFGFKVFTNLVTKTGQKGIVDVADIADTIQPVHPLYQDTMLFDLKMPIAITAVDLTSGKLVVFSNDVSYFQPVLDNAVFYPEDVPLVTACLASCAYPTIISPMSVGEYNLVDGGVLMTSPAPLFSKKALDHVFAVRLATDHQQNYFRRSLDIGVRSIQIMLSEQAELSARFSDTDYEMALKLTKRANFGNSVEVIEAGRKFVKANPIDVSELFLDY